METHREVPLNLEWNFSTLRKLNDPLLEYLNKLTKKKSLLSILFRKILWRVLQAVNVHFHW